ncbi:uncharacterized protein LOC144488567, partial [Mustelus asterias]
QSPVYYQSMASLCVSGMRHLPPPPPPKNAARLMALTLMAQAQSVREWQESRQLLSSPEEDAGSPETEHEDDSSPLYSTVDPLRKGSPRDHSPPQTNIQHEYRSDHLTAQNRVSVSPFIPRDLYRDGPVKLTQSLRGPISHCSIGDSTHTLPEPPPSSHTPHPVPPSPRLQPHSPPGTTLSSKSGTPSPPQGYPPRPVLRCQSVAAFPCLPPPPPRPPPPPLQPPQPNPAACAPGTLPKSRSLASLPSCPLSPLLPSQVPASGQHSETPGSFPLGMLGWASARDPHGKGTASVEAENELYAEIGADPGQSWLDLRVSPPILLRWEPPQPKGGYGHPIIPSQPLPPEAPPLLRAGSVPHPSGYHPNPCPVRGRVCRAGSECHRPPSSTCLGPGVHPACPDPPAPSPCPVAGNHAPEPTYVNLPGLPDWRENPAAPRQHSRIPRPASPPSHALGCPLPYRHRDQIAGFPREDGRGTQMAHPRSRSDPGDAGAVGSGRGPGSEPLSRSQSRASPRGWAPSEGAGHRPGGPRCPMAAHSRTVHPALVRALRPAAWSCTLHTGAHPRGPAYPQEPIQNPYAPSPEWGGQFPSTLTPHHYREVMVTYQAGPAVRAMLLLAGV